MPAPTFNTDNNVLDMGQGIWTIMTYEPSRDNGPYRGILRLGKDFHNVVINTAEGLHVIASFPSQNVARIENATSISSEDVLQTLDTGDWEITMYKSPPSADQGRASSGQWRGVLSVDRPYHIVMTSMKSGKSICRVIVPSQNVALAQDLAAMRLRHGINGK